MQQDYTAFHDTDENPASGISLIEQVTPLAHQVNSLDIEKIASVCIDKISALVGAQFGSLYLLDETNGILHLQKSNHPFLINKIVSLKQNMPSPMVMAVNSAKIMMVKDMDTHKEPIIRKSQRAFSENYKTKNCLITPLICHGHIVGVLNLSDKNSGDGFTDEDVVVVELLSQLIGASIGNIKLFEKIQLQANTDGLTGLANYRTFYEVLEKELWRSRRYGGQISMIMIDIDDLKSVNDAYGHRAGDRAIWEISNRITECIRQCDTAARYGGDEFAIVLPNTPLADATVVAQRIADFVAESPIIWKREQIHLSVSVGLGQYNADFSADDITNRSDQALYIAKQAGKNTIRIFQHAQKDTMC